MKGKAWLSVESVLWYLPIWTRTCDCLREGIYSP